MADEVRINGRASVLQIITVVAQFLLLPLLWLIYQMYLDVNVMKIQLARLEGRIESHQAASDLALRSTADKVRLEAEIENLKAMVDKHRAKSTYDRK
jgi:hypothetical protein